jgi:hypothetical protein
MGPPENPTNPSQNQATTGPRRGKRPLRRPRTRRCLLKGCEQRFRPQRARERYCSRRCREAARQWSRWKAQEKYRATPEGQQKRNGQSRRYRERVRNRKTSGKESVPEAARVIIKLPSEIFFRPFLRPARLLRGVHAPSPIPVAAVLLAGMPTRVGAGPEAGTALEGGAGGVRSTGKARSVARGRGGRGARNWTAKIVATY